MDSFIKNGDLSRVTKTQLKIALQDCFKVFEYQTKKEILENAKLEIIEIIRELKSRGVKDEELQKCGYNQVYTKKAFKEHFGLVGKFTDKGYPMPSGIVC